MGIQAPYLIVNKPTLVAGGGASNTPAFTSNVARVLMQGFAGMQVCGVSVRPFGDVLTFALPWRGWCCLPQPCTCIPYQLSL